MRPYRAFARLALVAGALCACSPAPAPQKAADVPNTPAAEASPTPWFICDGIDSPTIFAAERVPGGTSALITEYDKATGLPVVRSEYQLGEAAVSPDETVTTLLRDGGAAGEVRALNGAALTAPGSAYTPPITQVRIGDKSLACRWLPRTRFQGFSERRSWLVHEDDDGDLIYTAYDFLDPNRTARVELSEQGRTTRYSLEVRGGTEQVTPEGAHFRFENNGYAYAVDAPKDRPASVTATHGQALVQSETLLAYQLGQATD